VRVVATHALGNALDYFPSGKKTFVTALNLWWDSVTVGNSNSVLYIGLTRKGWDGGREWRGREYGKHPVTRQTSDGSGTNGEY